MKKSKDNGKTDFERVGLLKTRLQTVIVAVGGILLAGKFLAFYLTNSAAVLTDAMESIVNVVAGAISLYSIRLASRPKDADHPFGHGKIELISASLEGLMIAFAGGLIIYEGILRLINPAPIGRLDIGIGIVAAAGAVNFLMGSVSIHYGKKYGSVALVAGGKHLHSDTYSTVGLVVGLAVVYLTNIVWIDSAMALLFGALILFTGISILRKTIANLTDEADQAHLKKILSAISKHSNDDWIDVHNLKVISYGNDVFVDCDLTMPWFYNIEQGHEASDCLKKVITDTFDGNVIVSIHFDSCCQKHCSHCKLSDCRYRQEEFAAPQKLTLREVTGSDEFIKINKI